MATSKGADDLTTELMERFPRIDLESEVQGWAFLEKFAKGIECYSKLSDPSAKDDRWVGVCHFQSLNDNLALHYFRKAANRGENAARINLAHLLRFLDRSSDAAHELSQIETSSLKAYDAVLYYRVLSLHEETCGNIRDALRSAEEAWRRVQGLPEFPIMAPSILSQVGTLHSRVGRAKRALWFFDRALRVTEGFENAKAKMRRISVLVSLGKTASARNELNSINFHAMPAAFDCFQHLTQADCAWAEGNLNEALASFKTAIDKASTSNNNFEEFVARLSYATLSARQGTIACVESHLNRAEELVADRSDQLNYNFRVTLINFWRKLLSPQQCIDELTNVADEFSNMGCFQEYGWVKFHIAILREAELNQDVREDLKNLSVLSRSLENPSFLVKEIELQPGAVSASNLYSLAPKYAR